jgi:hypothetical protein
MVDILTENLKPIYEWVMQSYVLIKYFENLNEKEELGSGVTT